MNLEELIFNTYKNESIGARRFRAIVSKQYKLSIKEISNIYARINNYQIKKFGDRLAKGDRVDFISKEDSLKINKNMRSIKYHRLRNKGKEK